MPFAIVPPSFSEPTVPGPSHRKTPETPPPLLRRLSRPCIAARRVAGGDGRRERRGENGVSFSSPGFNT